MKRKTSVFVAGIIIVALAIVAGKGLTDYKAGQLTDSASMNKESIRIGGSISLTGVAAEFGEMSKKAMDMAAEEINAKGGINGRKVEILVEDDQTTPQGALSAYQKLVNVNHADALIGGIFDFTAHPIFPLSQKDKIAFISPVNFVVDKTFVMNEQSFVMYPRFDKVVMQLDSVIKDKEIKKLGMIRFESGFSESIQNTLKQIMATASGPQGKGVLVVDTYKTIGSSDFRTNILKIKNENTDAVFLDMLDFDVVKYLDVARTLGFKKQIIGYTSIREVVTNPKTKAADLADLEDAIVLDWEIPSKEFSDAFYKKYGMVPLRGADKSYEAVYALAEAVANTKSSADVAGYLETHTFKTINGEFSFGADHAVGDIPVKVLQVKNGKIVDIKSNI